MQDFWFHFWGFIYVFSVVSFLRYVQHMPGWNQIPLVSFHKDTFVCWIDLGDSITPNLKGDTRVTSGDSCRGISLFVGRGTARFV